MEKVNKLFLMVNILRGGCAGISRDKETVKGRENWDKGGGGEGERKGMEGSGCGHCSKQKRGSVQLRQ